MSFNGKEMLALPIRYSTLLEIQQLVTFHFTFKLFKQKFHKNLTINSTTDVKKISWYQINQFKTSRKER